MAKILNICTSEYKGVQKKPVDQAEVKADFGIVGDAHAGALPNRLLSLLAAESVAKVQEKITFPLKPGDFAENILTEGIALHTLPVGTRLRIGAIEAEITQVGKECHNDCAIRQAAGDCVMPREGVFVRPLNDGVLHPGDEIIVME